MTTPIHQHRFENGLCLLAEPVAGAQSLAMSVLAPGGLATEKPGEQGVASLLAEMICRGAGALDARAHSDALDRLGVRRGTGAGDYTLSVSATMIGTKFRDAAPLLFDMFRRPMLPENAIEPAKALALQSLASLDDEPQQKVFVELRRRHYPEPFNRSAYGLKEDLERATLDQVKAHAQRGLTPEGTVIGFAGRFDWNELKETVEKLLGDWRGTGQKPTPGAPAKRGYTHQAADTQQVHIGVAYDAPAETDPDSTVQRAAAAVLSGGMSGRLFTEIREKRGLCYSVYAAYSGQRERGAMLGYAGTTIPRAQETLDLLVAELKRLSRGAEEAEFARAIVGMKSRLVMQGESTGARAHAIAFDQHTLGRPRSLAELAAEVDAVTLDRLNKYLAAHPPGAMTIVTVGPSALKV
ncbi:MAG: insulinase family protein [Planctomycetes bacterium]|nr:insulinase family protein [Planctomycetota bacterium]